jgi:hypothetical protein
MFVDIGEDCSDEYAIFFIDGCIRKKAIDIFPMIVTELVNGIGISFRRKLHPRAPHLNIGTMIL